MTIKLTRRTFLFAGTAIAVVACSSGTQNGGDRSSEASGSQASGSVNVYSARHYDTDELLYDSFTENTGIRVRSVDTKANELIERLKSEGDKSPADLLVTVDAGNLWRAEEAGVLESISTPTLLSAIPEHLRHPDGLWFGLSKRLRGIIYNVEKVDPAQLSTYEDLADPKWKGQILVRSSNNIYNQSLMASLVANHGPEKAEAWAKGLVANFVRPPEGNDTSQIKACAEGVGSLAIANSYYLARMRKSDKPETRAIAEKVDFFFPNQEDRGIHTNISGAGVLKTAPNKDAAVSFLEHLVGRESQKIFAESNNEYPVVADVEIDPILQAFGTFREDRLNASELGKNNAEAVRVMDRAGWT